MFTIGNYVCMVGCVVVLLIVATFTYMGSENILVTIGVSLLCLVLCIGGFGCLGWWHTHSASGIRTMKDYHSELSNGIDREITITAEDGREIFHYEGKVDVESNHTDNYIKFESEQGKRYIIYYGIQDTITIIEK